MDVCFVFVGSVVGLKGNAGQSVYSASKAGLEGFTRSLAKEVASRNIKVNLLAPGTSLLCLSLSVLSASALNSLSSHLLVFFTHPCPLSPLQVSFALT